MKTNVLDKLSDLQDEGAVTAIDVEFCRFLKNVDDQINEVILLAACLTSRAYREGNVCMDLTNYSGQKIFREFGKNISLPVPDLQAWKKALQQSSVVGRPGDFTPLILDDADRLYMQKLWQHEQNLARRILEKTSQEAPEINADVLKDGLARLFEEQDGIDWQKIAVVAAVNQLFTVISGGPGTGKTTTIIRLLILLLEQGRQRGTLPAIALAAPTGKAAARMETSIQEAKSAISTSQKIREALPVEAVTIHQLLGAGRHSRRFRFNEDNPLPYDCIIIDEVSMVDQMLMSRLLDAVDTKTRLVLLGDKDQLASVEAGSVLGDICGMQISNTFSEAMRDCLGELDIHLPDKYIDTPHPLTDHIILLKKNYRFGDDSGIARLATAVNAGRGDEAWDLLHDDHFSDISLKIIRDYESFEQILADNLLKQFSTVQSVDTPAEKLRRYRRFKILAAHRVGPWGTEIINNRMEDLLRRRALISPYETWYEGRPVVINRNDHSLGLSNGDLGVCIQSEDERLKVYIARDDEAALIAPSRLPDFDPAFALTVHKSQGSEFDRVLLVLPEASSKLLSRELIYTAVSRARAQVTIVSSEKAFKKAVQHGLVRHSGLQDKLWQKN